MRLNYYIYAKKEWRAHTDFPIVQLFPRSAGVSSILYYGFYRINNACWYYQVENKSVLLELWRGLTHLIVSRVMLMRIGNSHFHDFLDFIFLQDQMQLLFLYSCVFFVFLIIFPMKTCILFMLNQTLCCSFSELPCDSIAILHLHIKVSINFKSVNENLFLKTLLFIISFFKHFF